MYEPIFKATLLHHIQFKFYQSFLSANELSPDQSQEHLIGMSSENVSKCLKYLYFKDLEERCTCRWVLSQPAFQSWDASQVGLVWTSGNPGAGKSTLLKYILEKKLRDDTAATAKSFILSFFFHSRGSPLQKSLLDFYRSMLHQLLNRMAPRMANILQAFDHNSEKKGAPGINWDWHLDELREFFQSSLLEI